MTEEQVRSQLRQYITSELIRDASYPLQDDEGIITGGLMDSMSLAQLGVYVEEAYNIYIPDPDLTVDKMNTLNQIVARVLRDLK